MPFDLSLSYPQWQGSGRYENLPRGAEAVSEICGRFAPLVRVPTAGGDDEADDELLHGIRRWQASPSMGPTRRCAISPAGPASGWPHCFVMTREALFEALLCTNLDALTQKADEVETSTSADEALLSWVRELMAFAQSYRGVVAMMAAVLRAQRCTKRSRDYCCALRARERRAPI